jgi:DNA-binding transcriptional LysR family regulator
MELINLRILQGLVVDPHLSRVAARFHLTQSALSKRLHNLEEELGVKLFDRRGARGLEPTPAAREISTLSEQVLTAWDSGLQKAKRHQDEPAHFGIVGPQIFMREVVLPWWTKVAPLYPDLSLQAHISALSRVSFELVQAGMDVGILEHKEELTDFICKPIFAETWGVVAHRSAKVDLEKDSTLKKLSWGTLSHQHNPVDEWLVKRQKMPPPFYRVYWNDLTAVAAWVAETPNSATVLPLHACQSLLDQKRVQFVSLGRDSKTVLYLAYRQNHPHKQFIQHLLKISEELQNGAILSKAT